MTFLFGFINFCACLIFLGCPPGYTGVECIFHCVFPDDGLGCYKKCECTEDMCDFMFGCKFVSKAGSFIVI